MCDSTRLCHSLSLQKFNVFLWLLSFSEYLKRMTLYKKPIWQCESTGKSKLTYKEALESEKIEKERVKLPEELQKRLLMHIQFRKHPPTSTQLLN